MMNICQGRLTMFNLNYYHLKNNMRKKLNILFGCVFFVAIYIFLVWVSTFRVLGEDRDYNNYLNWFSYSGNVQEGTKELSFLFFRYVINSYLGGEVVILFLLYAVLGVFFKLLAIKKYSNIPYLSLFIYLVMYFPLHEYTQIRAGVAAGLILLAIPDLVKNNGLHFFLKIGFAVLFHWSAAYVFLLYPLVNFLSLRFVYSLPMLGVFLLFFKDYFSAFIGFVFSVIPSLDYYYSTHSGHDESFNVFNFLFLMNFSIWLVIAFFCPKKKLYIKNNFSVSFAFFSFSVFSYLLFSSLGKPVVSFRLYELLNISLLFLLPGFVMCFKQKIIPFVFVFAYGFINMYHLVFNVDIFPSLGLGGA